jgi:hypothetical protein
MKFRSIRNMRYNSIHLPPLIYYTSFSFQESHKWKNTFLISVFIIKWHTNHCTIPPFKLKFLTNHIASFYTKQASPLTTFQTLVKLPVTWRWQMMMPALQRDNLFSSISLHVCDTSPTTLPDCGLPPSTTGSLSHTLSPLVQPRFHQRDPSPHQTGHPICQRP